MKLRILMILSTLILLILGSGITYSLFTSITNLKSMDQNVAKFVFNAERLNELQFPLIDLKPGDIKEYDFAVSNNHSGVLTNVSVSYQMLIKTYHLVPIDIELYKVIDEENEELVIKCNEECLDNEECQRNEEHELVCESPLQEMGHSSEVLDNYKLKVIFSSEYNDPVYADLVDYLNIEIKSWQKLED